LITGPDGLRLGDREDRDVPPELDREREELDRDRDELDRLDRLLLERVLDGVRLIVLRFAIAQMFSLDVHIIPQPGPRWQSPTRQ